GVFLATLSFAIGPLTWSRTGSMITPRQNHTAALISACEVLVVGGNLGVDNGLQATASRYQNGPGTWRNAATMPSSRQFHPETWSTTGNMITARRDHTATLLQNGQVLVTGGTAANGAPLSSAELYSPATGVWSATGTMSDARAFHTATVLANGAIVLISGGVG